MGGEEIISPSHFKDIRSKEDLKKRVDWLRKTSGGRPIGIKLNNFLRVSTEELKAFARMTGNNDVHGLAVTDLCTTSSEIANYTTIAHV